MSGHDLASLLGAGLMLALFTAYLIYALKTGRMASKHGFIDRRKDPYGYQGSMIVFSMLAAIGWAFLIYDVITGTFGP